MRALNEAFEAAAAFGGFLDRIILRDDRSAHTLPAADQQQSDPAIKRRPDENRAQHRARLKRMGRLGLKSTKAAA